MTSTEQLLMAIGCLVLVSQIATVILMCLFSKGAVKRINGLSQRLSVVTRFLRTYKSDQAKDESGNSYLFD